MSSGSPALPFNSLPTFRLGRVFLWVTRRVCPRRPAPRFRAPQFIVFRRETDIDP
jgi:hypothetical protein